MGIKNVFSVKITAVWNLENVQVFIPFCIQILKFAKYFQRGNICLAHPWIGNFIICRPPGAY